MSEKKSHLGIPMTADQYAEEWEANSKSFFEEGYYRWMSQQLGSVETVLEIGCGSGNGTLALFQDGRLIIAIEPNEKLANLAFENLKANNVPVEFSSLDALADNTHSNTSSVFIVRQDAFETKIDSLQSKLSVDAIVCWLIGAEPDRISSHIGKEKHNFTGPEMAEYREKIHQRCYELGKKLLTVGGCVHIVDRTGLRSWSDKDYFRDEFSKFHSGMAGEGYTIGKSDTFLTRARSNIKTSQIQYLVQDADQINTIVFASVKGRII